MMRRNYKQLCITAVFLTFTLALGSACSMLPSRDRAQTLPAQLTLPATAQPSGTSTVEPTSVPTEEPDGALPPEGYFLHGAESAPTPTAHGGLSITEMARRIHDEIHPQDEIGETAAPAYQYEGMEYLPFVGDCYWIAFGVDTAGQFTATRRFIAAEDGSVREYDAATDAYEEILPASIDLGVSIGKDVPRMRIWRDGPAIFVEALDRSLIQSIPYDENDYYDETYELSIEDTNFDGYLDFTQLFSAGIANHFYHLWLWDVDARQFAYYEPYVDFSNPSVDAKNKRITTYERFGAMENVSGNHAWIDGELEYTSYTIQTFDEKTERFYLTTHMPGDDGEFIQTEELIMTEDELYAYYEQQTAMQE